MRTFDINNARLSTEVYFSGNRVDKPLLDSAFQSIHVDFFNDNTHIFSGQSSATRNLTVPHHVLLHRLSAETPALLRKLATANPSLRIEAETTLRQAVPGTLLTKLQADMLSAIYAAEQPNFGPAKEYDLRFAASERAYVKKLAIEADRREHLTLPTPKAATKEKEPAEEDGSAEPPKHLTLPTSTEATMTLNLDSLEEKEPAEEDSSAEHPRDVRVFDPKSHVATMISPVTFYGILKAHKVRYTTCVNETRCPLHDAGPIKELQLKAVEAKLADINERIKENEALREKLRDEFIALDSHRLELDAYVQRYRLHLDQYKSQRSYVAGVLDDLQPGEAVLFRDFVNSYNFRGAHIKNLQLVLRWRDKEGGPLRTFKMANFCSDPATQSCDAFYYKDVMEHHLRSAEEKGSGFLSSFKKVYIVGDHGPHFSSKSTLWAESKWFEQFGTVVEPIYLCSYHAYNLCDGAGSEHTRLARTHNKDNTGRLCASGYADLTNSSGRHTNSVAIPWARIARGTNIFPAESQFTGSLPDLRKVCHIRYELPPAVDHSSKSVFHEGLLLAKYVSTDSTWAMVDLLRQSALKNKREPACLWCSNKLQRCVLGSAHHLDAGCVAHKVAKFDKATLAALLPDHQRLGMLEPQLIASTEPEVARLLCKLLTCKKDRRRRRWRRRRRRRMRMICLPS